MDQFQPMKTLFVIDDNELDIRILRLILARTRVFGHELYFKEAQTLMDYIKTNKDDISNLPDVLFLDINMLNNDGWRVLNFLALNYDKIIKPISVYIVSASVNAVEREEAMNHHFVKDFVPKPISLHKIMAIAGRVKEK